MWSYATLRYHPGDDLLDTFAAMVTKHAHHFKPQELSNVAWSYASLSHYPGDDFMRVVEMAMSHHAAFEPQGETVYSHTAVYCAPFTTQHIFSRST